MQTKETKEDKLGKLIGISVTILFILIVLFSSVYTISAGHRGVLLTFGKPDMNVKEEGIHVKVPFVQKVVKMEVRTIKIE